MGMENSGQVPDRQAFLGLIAPDGDFRGLLWRQNPAGKVMPAKTVEVATHWCPARLKPGMPRRKVNWAGQLAIVIDDVYQKRNVPKVEPSFRISTRSSERREQWVYLIDDPTATIEAVQVLLTALNHEGEYGDPSAYGPVQIFRVPGGALPPGKTEAATLVELSPTQRADGVLIWTIDELYADFRFEIGIAERIEAARQRREERRSRTPGEFMPEVEALITLLSPDLPRDASDGWFTVIMVIHTESNGSDLGLKLAHRWSAGGKSYDPVDLDYQWENLDARDPDDPVRVGTLRKMALEANPSRAQEIIEAAEKARDDPNDRALSALKDRGPKPLVPTPVPGEATLTRTALDIMLARFVLVPNGVIDLDDDSDTVWSIDAMARRHALYDHVGPRGGRTSVVKNTWAVDHRRKVSDRSTRLFDPLHPPGFIETRVEATGVIGWVNGYRPRPLDVTEVQPSDEMAVHNWLAFVEHVYPHDSDYALDWMASKLQHPERKQVALLSATATTGTGRTSCALVLGALLNSYTVVTMAEVMGTFSGFLQNLLVVVNEIEGGGHEAAHFKRKATTMNRLNEVIEVGNGPQMIRKPYMAAFTAETYCSFLLNSNHVNALPIVATQRRISTTLGNTRRLPKSRSTWVRRLTTPAGKADLDAIHRHLLARNVEGFEFWEAHDGAKEALMTASRTPFDASMFEALELLGHPVVFTTKLLREVLDSGALRARHDIETHTRIRGMAEQERERALNSWVQENSEAPRCLSHQTAKAKLKLAGEVLLPRVVNGHPQASAAHSDYEQLRRDTEAWFTRAKRFIANKPTIVPDEPPQEEE